MYRNFYNTFIQKLRGKLFFGSSNRIDLIIIGAQKCGTTALFEFLNSHQKLIGSDQKEINFFNNDENYKMGIDYYHGFFPKRKNGLIYFEASPSYLQDNNYVSCERIYEYNSEIKMIVMLRNPIERAFSAFNMYRKKWKLNEDWFDSWKIPEREYIQRDYRDYESFNYFINHELDVISKGKNIEAPVLNTGKYVDHIEKYFKIFNPTQFLIIDSSNLLTNTHKELNRVLSFLKINEKTSWSFPDGQKIFEGKYEEDIDSITLSKLIAYYKPPNDKLYTLIGIDFKW